MSRIPEDIFGTPENTAVFSSPSKEIFSDKATQIFQKAAAKASAVQNTVDEKKVNLGVITKEELLLQRAINYTNPDYRTDPNSLLTDKEAREGFGQVLNVGGAFVAGTGVLADDILSAPKNIGDAAVNVVNSPDTLQDPLQAALQRVNAKNAVQGFPALPGIPEASTNPVTGAITDAGNATGNYVSDRLNSLTGQPDPLLDTVAIPDGPVTTPSALEELSKFGDAVENTAGRAFNPAKVRQLAEDAGIAFDESDGFVDSTVALAGVAVTNPVAAAEVFAQSLPQMLALTAKGVTQSGAFLSTTASRIEESTAIFVEEHGREPNIGEVSNLVGTSIAQTIIDLGASKIVLGKELTSTSENLLKAAAEKITGTAVGKVTSKIPGVAPVVRATGAGTTEAVEEGSQGVLSELGGKQDSSVLTDPAVRRAAAVDATLGAGAGGVGRTAAGLKDEIITTKEAVETVADGAKTLKDKLGRKGTPEDVVNAVASGNPQNVVDTVNDVDLTTLDAGQRREVINPLLDAQDALREKANKLEGDAKQEALAELKEVDARNRKIIEAHQKLLDAENGITPETTKIPEDATPEEAKETIGRTFGSAGFRSDLTKDRAEELQSDPLFTANATPTQKKELNLIIERHKTAEGVTDEILNGDEFGLFKGANEYLDDLDSAISLDNQAKAGEAINNIEAFLRRQVKKANTLLTLTAQIKKTEGIALQDNLSVAELDTKLGTKYAEVLGPAFKIGQATPIFTRSTIIGKDIPALKAVLAEATYRFENTYAGAAPVAPAPVASPKATSVSPKETKVADTSTQAAPETALERAVRETAEATAPVEEEIPESLKRQSGDGTPDSEISDKIVPEITKKQSEDAAADKLNSITKEAGAIAKELDVVSDVDLTPAALKTKKSILKELNTPATPLTLKRLETARKLLLTVQKVAEANKVEAAPVTEEAEPTPQSIEEFNAEIDALMDRADEQAFESTEAVLNTANPDAEVTVTPVETKVTTVPIEDSILGEKLLVNGVINPVDGTSSKDIFEAVRQPVGGLVNTIKNLLSNINIGNLMEVAPVPQEAIDVTIGFLNDFVTRIQGGQDVKPLLQILDDQRVFKTTFTQNPMAYLLQKTAKGKMVFNQNLLTIMGLTSSNWLATQASGTLFNYQSDINSILGRDKNAEITDTEYELLGTIGSSRTKVAENLGRAAFKQLGLRVQKGVDGTLETRMEQAIGQLMLEVMARQGYITEVEVDLDYIKTGKEGVKANFIRIATDLDSKQLELSPEVSRVIESAVQARAITNLMMEPPVKSNAPTFVVSEKDYKHEKQKGTIQDISLQQQANMRNTNKIAHGFKPAMTRVLKFLGAKEIRKYHGYVENLLTVNIDQELSVKGKNLGIAREIKYMEDFIAQAEEDNNLDKPFYFEQVVFRQTRYNNNSNTISLSDSKIHRHFFGVQADQLTVDTPAQRTQFAYAVMQAFGEKIDKQSSETTLAAFTELLADPVIQTAVEALKIIDSGAEIEPADAVNYRKQIGAAVKQGGEASYTLDALVALSKYSPDKAFDVFFSGEFDGITSGPTIANLQNMAEEDSLEIAAAGGIHVDGTREHTVWSENPRNKDIYERLAERWQAEVTATLASDPVAKGIEHLIGTMDAAGNMVNAINRSLAKNPVTVDTFGASIKAVKLALSKQIINSISSQLTEHADDSVQVARILNAVNAIIGDPKLMVPLDGNPLDLKLGSKQKRMLNTKITNTYGATLETVLNKQSVETKAIRELANTAMQAMHKAFQVRYDTRIKEETIANDNKPLTNTRQDEIFKELQEFMAIVKTPLSGHEYKDGFVSIKSKRVVDRSLPVQLSLSTPRTNGKKSVVGYGSTKVYEDGGVGGYIGLLHSIDSAVNQKLSTNFAGVNLYDAYITNLDQAEEARYLANKSFYAINKEYSILNEIETSFNRVMSTLQTGYPVEFTLVNSLIRDEAGKFRKGKLGSIAQMQIALQEKVVEVESAKKEILENPSLTVSQYGGPDGGNYRPSEDSNSDLFGLDTTEDTEEKTLKDIEEITQGIIDDIDKRYNSSEEGIDLGLFDSITGDPLSSANAQTVFDVMDQLGTKKESTTHQKYLRGLFGNLITKALEPLNELSLKVRATGDDTVGAVADVKANGVVTPTVFVASSIGVKGNAVQMSAQEVFTHELVHMITRNALDDPGNFHIKQQIKKIFNDVEKIATVDMFLPDQGPHSADTLKAATARYTYIFNNSQAQNKLTLDDVGHKIHNTTNDYLHEFVAFGMTNAKVRRLLSQVDTKVAPKVTETFMERLSAVWENILDRLANRITKTSNLSGDAALDVLVHQLTELHERKRQSILNKIGISAEINKKFGAALHRVIWKPMVALSAKHPNPRNYNIPGRIFNGTVAAFTHPEEFGRAINQVRKNVNLAERNFMVSLARENVGSTPALRKFYTLLRLSKHWIDQERKRVAEEVSLAAKSSFLTEFSPEEAESINRVFLKADLLSLIDNGFSIDTITELLRDNSKLQDAIRTVESAMAQYAEVGYYTDQAIGLGRWMATGQTHIDGQKWSTHLIASLASVRTHNTLTGDLSQRVTDIEVLATLFALDYTARHERTNMANVISREFAASSGKEYLMNGIISLSNLHRQFKADALRDNFSGNPNQMIKGWTKEIYNPVIDLKFVILKTDPAELKAQLQELAQAGYTRVEGTLEKDIKDPNKNTAVIYLRNDITTNTWLKSIAGLVAERVKGTTLADAYINEGTAGANVAAIIAKNTVMAREDNFVRNQFNVPTANRVGKTGKLIPISDDLGNTTGYRYTMSEAMKIRLLEKDDNFVNVIGRMHGTVIDKKATKEVNRKLVDLNKEDFNDNFAKDPSAFVEISQKSTDKHLKEIYDLLPDDTKDYIKATYPKGRMWVRDSLVDLQFGYRKFTVSNTAIGGFINDVFSAMLPGSNYKNIVGGTEHIWQGIVSTAKDYIVVKSGIVLAGNVMSNEMLLMLKGVPTGDTFTQQAVALRALDTFMGEVKEERALKRELASSVTLTTAQRAQKELELVRIKDSLATNPIKPLIDEGVFQAIIEDIEGNDQNNQFSIRNRIETKFTETFPGIANNTPRGFVQGYKQAYFAHDTRPYKLLLAGTQVSDFIARFALYQHHLSQNMSHEEALADVIETFINYDIPTSKQLQYVNDIGILLFTKFLFRIQKVIFKSMKAKPATALAQYSIQSVLGDASDISDQFIITHGLINSFPDIIDKADNFAAIEYAKDSMDAVGSIL